MLVNLPVPEEHYLDMVAHLAAIATTFKPNGHAIAEPITAPSTPAPDAPETSTNGWSREELRRLKTLIAENKGAMSQMNLACADPGKRISFDEVVKDSGREGKTGSDLAGFTRLIHANFGPKRGWPLKWAQVGTRTLYYAEALIAIWWTEE